MNAFKPPEPSSEQLLAFLDAQIALQRSKRTRGSQSHTVLRVGVALLIFAALVVALFLLSSARSTWAPAPRVSERPTTTDYRGGSGHKFLRTERARHIGC